jgi:hypothetical protein
VIFAFGPDHYTSMFYGMAPVPTTAARIARGNAEALFPRLKG